MARNVSHVFHGCHIVDAHLEDIFWVHSNDISFDLGSDVVVILCDIGGVDKTKEHVTRRTNLHDVH